MYQETSRRQESLRDIRCQAELFLAALFAPHDLIEIRAIETWTEQGTTRSRPTKRLWLQCWEFSRWHDDLQQQNETSSIYFGVNGRTDARGTKNAVAECRHVWADIDHVDHATAAQRWARLALFPTVVVNSGHGIHAYWRLATPVSVGEAQSREQFEATVRRFSAELGGDATQDVTRLLRLPGFMNVKSKKNGNQPVPCTLVSLDVSHVYALAEFVRWATASPSDESVANDRRAGGRTSLSTSSLAGGRDHRRIAGLLRYLDRAVEDRSRRDFAVICGLLQLGLSRDEIWDLVQDHSKFASHGEPYFEVTMQNALCRLHGQ